MHFRRRVVVDCLFFTILIAAWASPFSPSARAATSTSPSFTNSQSALDSSGQPESSSHYRSHSAVGEISVTTTSSSSFLTRAGIIPLYYFPARILDLSATSCTTGQMVLNWTAPGNDGEAPGTRARTYVIKLSTDPALNPALSTTLFFQDQPAPGAPPSPVVQGSTQGVVINGLITGATYYVAMVALEADGSQGPISPPTTSQIGTSGVPLTDFTGYTGFRVGILNWTIPALSGSLAACAPNDYAVLRATSSTAQYAQIATTTGTAYTDTNVLVGSTFYYQLAGLNNLAQIISESPVKLIFVRTKPPLPPLRVAVAMSGSTATLHWEAPTEFNFGLPFSTPTATQPDELTGFHIWKSTAVAGAPWTLAATVATGTVQWTDPASGPGQYYRVTGVNLTEESRYAVQLDIYGNGYVISPDGLSNLTIPPTDVAALMPGTSGGYWLTSSSHTVYSAATEVQAATYGQRIYSSARFDVMQATTPVTSSFAFPAAGKVKLSYAPSAIGTQWNGMKPDQSAIFWNNGASWVNIYGRMDGPENYMLAEVQRPGEFQLRSIERTQDFLFNPGAGGLSNKFITPNGDGKNDDVVFTFSNPRCSQVTGRIYDLKGAQVATLPVTDDPSCPQHMMWDAKSNGTIVTSGVYVYQLEADGKVFNGTVVVIR